MPVYGLRLTRARVEGLCLLDVRLTSSPSPHHPGLAGVATMQSLRAGPRRPWVLGHQVLAAVSPGDSPQLPPEAAVLVSCPPNVVWSAQESIGPANGCPVGDAGLLFSLQCKPSIGPGVGGADHSLHWRRGRGPHSWAEAGAGLPLCPVCLSSVSQILPQICPAGLFGGTSGPWTA